MSIIENRRLRDLFRSEYNDLPNTAAFDRTIQERSIGRIDKFRRKLIALELDAYIISSSDVFSNEYPPYPDLLLYQLLSFDGSAGVPGGGFRAFAIVTASDVYLIVDGRYIEEAQQICGKIGVKTVLYESMDWTNLLEVGKVWKTVGLDKDIFLGGDNSYLSQLIHGEMQHVSTSSFLITDIIRTSQNRKYIIFEDQSNRRMDLLEVILQSLDHATAWYLTFSEDISIMFGIKGNQSDISPFAPCRSFIEKDRIAIFIPDDVELLVDSHNITPMNFSFISFAQEHNYLVGAAERIKKLYVDYNLCPLNKIDLLKMHFNDIDDRKTPIAVKKLIKTSAQIESIRRTNSIDNIAVTRFLLRLQSDVALFGKSETDLADLLEEYRTQHESYVGRSFPWVLAIDENSSLPHYKPRRGNAKIWGPDKLILVDTGGQFRTATTDATRVLYSSANPAAEIRLSYTAVLRGHIALSLAVFAEGITGHCLDLIARQPLYRNEMDFRHGTGHGVGVFASVHEGTARISPYAKDVGLVEGLLLTNEPGFYVENRFGIRIENTLVVKNTWRKDAYDRSLLRFDPLTYLPYAPNLIELNLLDDTERKWLLGYYDTVIDLIPDEGDKEILIKHKVLLSA